MHRRCTKVGFIKVRYILYCMYNTEKIELRRVQALQGERSFTLVFPKEFAIELGVGKGDFLKCRIDGKSLVVEKVEP
jgi:hypothetical protein